MLTAEQRASYEQIRQTALAELTALDQEITSELTRIKKRLLELQEDKRAVKQIVDGASARLGLGSSPPFKEITLADLNRSNVSTSEPAHATPMADSLA